jgi:hypothetical protein
MHRFCQQLALISLVFKPHLCYISQVKSIIRPILNGEQILESLKR